MKHRYLRETLCTSGRARGMAALWREGKGPLGAQAQRGFARGPTSPASGRVPFSPVCPRPSLCISQDLMTVSHLSLRLLFCGFAVKLAPLSKAARSFTPRCHNPSVTSPSIPLVMSAGPRYATGLAAVLMHSASSAAVLCSRACVPGGRFAVAPVATCSGLKGLTLPTREGKRQLCGSRILGTRLICGPQFFSRESTGLW